MSFGRVLFWQFDNCRRMSRGHFVANITSPFSPRSLEDLSLGGSSLDVLADTFFLSPDKVCRHAPEMMSHTLTVESALPETRMLFLSSIPDVSDW